MLIADLSELRSCLEAVQRSRQREVRCELTMGLSDAVRDATLIQALTEGMPMVKRIEHRISRSRGRGVRLTAKLTYRDGVRMLEKSGLSEAESTALTYAQGIIAPYLTSDDPAERFRQAYEWLCSHVRYVHTSPGHKGYELLVGAVGALTHAEANCQGFADALYLLCGLLDIPCTYRCGWGTKQLHMWNEVYLDGIWQIADASKAARTRITT